MKIEIELTTLIGIGTVLGLAGTAVVWMARKIEELRRLPRLILKVDGDREATDPKLRDGIVGRLDDTENTVKTHDEFLRAFARALRLPPVTNERELTMAIRRAIYGDGPGPGGGGDTTGNHKVFVMHEEDTEG